MIHRNLLRRVLTASLAIVTITDSGAWAQPAIPPDIGSLVSEATRESNPQTPAAILKAVEDLLNVGDFELANEYLQRFLDAQPSAAELTRIQREMGTGFFVRLTRIAEVAPRGAQVADRVMSAADGSRRDPQSIRRWVGATRDDDQDVRRAARAALQEVGPEAVPFLLQALESESLDEAGREYLLTAISVLGDAAEPPLIGALGSNRASVMLPAIQALQRITPKRAVPFLLRSAWDAAATPRLREQSRAAIRTVGSAPTRAEATALLRDRVDRLLSDPIVMTADHLGQSTVWLWDPDRQTVSPRVLPRETAALLIATWLADDLYHIDPEQATHRRRLLATQLGWAKLQGGLDQPLPTSLAAALKEMHFSAQDLARVLTSDQGSFQVPVATAAAELLGRPVEPSGDSVSLDVVNALSAALRAPHRRIRMAAAEAILRWQPPGSFAGSADLIESLVRVAGARGSRQVIVVHPRNDEANRMTGWLTTAGFEPIIVRNGQEAYRVALREADLELILISDAVTGPHWRELIPQLAFDYRTASLPVCLMARGDRLRRAEQAVGGWARVTAFPLPHDSQTLARLIAQSLPLAGEYVVPAQQRLQHADWAFTWLERLATDRDRYGQYDLQAVESRAVAALSVPSLSVLALRTLGALGTPVAQSALVDFAGRTGPPVEHRRLAAEQFERAIQRQGVLLTSQQIHQHYDRYNRSVEVDHTSAGILDDIMDALETLDLPR